MDVTLITKVWAELLDEDEVGVDDDFFFDLGGNSLMAAAAIARLSSEGGLPLEIRDLYLAPTARELGEHTRLLGARLAELGAARDRDGLLVPFALALAELSAAAADRLLPERAELRLRALEGGGGTRVAVLREIRGAGGCHAETRPDGSVLLRRDDGTAYGIRLTSRSPHPVLEFTEAGAAGGSERAGAEGSGDRAAAGHA